MELQREHWYEEDLKLFSVTLFVDEWKGECFVESQ